MAYEGQLGIDLPDWAYNKYVTPDFYYGWKECQKLGIPYVKPEHTNIEHPMVYPDGRIEYWDWDKYEQFMQRLKK